MSASEAPAQDRVTKVLIIVLLLVTAVAWLAMAWMTILTYQGALPLLRHMVSASGAALMTREDLVAGKAGFQKADLMDYGSLQCMGSYFGEDYTASVLVALARQTQASVEDRDRMREMLRGIDLRAEPVVVPDAVAGVIVKVRGFLARRLREDDYAAGYSKAHSLEPAEAKAVANFLIYSGLTTVAIKPGTGMSWTANGPPELLVGNSPPAAALSWSPLGGTDSRHRHRAGDLSRLHRPPWPRRGAIRYTRQVQAAHLARPVAGGGGGEALNRRHARKHRYQERGGCAAPSPTSRSALKWVSRKT